MVLEDDLYPGPVMKAAVVKEGFSSVITPAVMATVAQYLVTETLAGNKSTLPYLMKLMTLVTENEPEEEEHITLVGRNYPVKPRDTSKDNFL